MCRCLLSDSVAGMAQPTRSRDARQVVTWHEWPCEGRHDMTAMRRASIAIPLALVLAACLAPPLVAAGVDRIEGDSAEDHLLPGGTFCAFDVLVENPKGVQDTLVWERPDGAVVVRFVGPFFVRLTNLASGASLYVSLAGPGFIEVGESFTFLTAGRWLLHPAGGGDGVWIVSGRTDSTDGAAAGLDSLQGRAIDVCAALA